MKLAETRPSANRAPDGRFCCKSQVQVSPIFCWRGWVLWEKRLPPLAAREFSWLFEGSLRRCLRLPLISKDRTIINISHVDYKTSLHYSVTKSRSNKDSWRVFQRNRRLRHDDPLFPLSTFFQDGEAGDIGFIVDAAGCSQVENEPLEARSSFQTEPVALKCLWGGELGRFCR